MIPWVWFYMMVIVSTWINEENKELTYEVENGLGVIGVEEDEAKQELQRNFREVITSTLLNFCYLLFLFERIVCRIQTVIACCCCYVCVCMYDGSRVMERDSILSAKWMWLWVLIHRAVHQCRWLNGDDEYIELGLSNWIGKFGQWLGHS